MYSKILPKMLILTLLLIFITPFSYVKAADSTTTHVLLLYDSLAKQTTKEGNIEALQRMLAAFGVQVTLRSYEHYEPGMLAQFNKVIGIQNTADLPITNSDYLHEFENYTGDYMHIGMHVPSKVQSDLNMQTKTANLVSIQLQIDRFTQSVRSDQSISYIASAIGTTYGSLSSDNNEVQAPFAVRHNQFVYIPYYEQGNLSELMVAYPLKDWLGITHKAQTYVLFKEIYPFSDLTLLMQLADQLYEAGIPFIASVRPVFSNTDYPAMLRYLEALKYVQSKNGTILVNAPVVQPVISQERPLDAQMESFINVLADYDIAPLGLGAEMYWSYDRQYGDKGMAFFNSVVLFPNENIMHREQTPTSYSFASSGFSLNPRNLNQANYSGTIPPQLPMDTFLTYDFINDADELDQVIQSLTHSWGTFGDYKNSTHTVRTTANTIASHNGILSINHKAVDLNDVPQDVKTDYEYIEEQEQSFETLFGIQNKIFVVLIMISLLVFGMLFIIGYQLYKRKYFKRE